MTPEDQAFYRQLGQRIAERRKRCGLTQQQLADTLGISQQALAHYEVGRLRVAVSMLGPIAKVVDVSIVELLEGAAENDRRGAGCVDRPATDVTTTTSRRRERR